MTGTTIINNWGKSVWALAIAEVEVSMFFREYPDHHKEMIEQLWLEQME